MGWVNLINARHSFTLCHGNTSKHSLSCQGFPGIMGSGVVITPISLREQLLKGKPGQQLPGDPEGGDTLRTGEVITPELGAWLQPNV